MPAAEATPRAAQDPVLPQSAVIASCFIATTAWAGSQRLCEALRATGLAGYPRDYFNPFQVARRGHRWGLLGSGEEFAPRYLRAVAAAATGDNGVLSVNLPWSHQRWLTRIARTALSDEPEDAAYTDAEILEKWYPRIRYVYVTSSDKSGQAARWYLARRDGAVPAGATPPGGLPDFQEVRWIEALITRQEQAWESYFRVHAINAHRVKSEEFLEHPEDTVRGIIGWLGQPGPAAQPQSDMVGQPDPAETADWLPDYRRQRDQLSAAIGVRQVVSSS